MIGRRASGDHDNDGPNCCAARLNRYSMGLMDNHKPAISTDAVKLDASRSAIFHENTLFLRQLVRAAVVLTEEGASPGAVCTLENPAIPLVKSSVSTGWLSPILVT